MSQKTKVTQDPTLTDPVIRREGDSVAFAITVSGATTITSPTMTMYKEGSSTDISSTYLTGSTSVSGNVIVTKTTTGLIRGDYIVSVSATVDGQTYVVATIPFIVKRRGER